MSLLERLNEDIKTAMKNKEKDKLTTIRMVKASLQNEAIKLGRELSDEEELTVLSREVKQRKDSLQEFEKAGRHDLIEKIKTELTYVNVYLPKQLTQDELIKIIHTVIEEVQATSAADMGKVMAGVMPKVKGKADGGIVNKLVREQLSSL